MRVLSAVVLVIILFVLILKGIFVYATSKDSSRVCFRDYCFNVELAITESERARGLMFRDYLAKDKGMLFVYKKKGIYPFWMKNTKIPLDMIWINETRRVVFVRENVSSCDQSKCDVICPDKLAKYVLEVPSGSAKRIGLKPGDTLSFYNIP